MKLTTCSVYLGLSVLLTSNFTTTPAIAVEVLSKTQIAQAQTKERKRIAVLNFDFAPTSSSGFYYGWLGGIGPAKGVGDILTNLLVSNGTYIVVERSKIEQILQEQNLGASGRIDAGTAAQIGRILGVDVVLIGTITEFNVEQNSSGNNICLFGICAGKDKNKAIVRLTARLVNTTTAEILAAAEGKAEAQKSSDNLRVASIYSGYKTTDADTLLSTAAEEALTKVAAEVIAAEPKVAGSRSLPNVSAVVADVTGNQITINKGSDSGFKNGMMLSIERVVKEVKDPQTGNILRTITSPVGKVELIEVSNSYATGKIISGTGFKIGDVTKAVP